MRFEKAPRLHSFMKRYTFADMEDKIQTLVFNDKAEALTNLAGLGTDAQIICNGYLKDWKCYTEINSLTEQAFPNLPEFATDSERLSATLNVEWGSPRFHCCIWSTNKTNPSNIPTLGDWILEGKFSLYKAFGYPYRIYYPFDLLTNNIAREFAAGVRFGFSIENAGYGFPITSGNSSNQDVISFSGNWTQEIIVISPEPSPVVVNVTGGSSSSSPSPSPNPSPTPTPPPEPVITLTFPAGSLRTYNNPSISYNITGLTPSTSFTLTWQSGTTTLVDEKTETLTANSSGSYSGTLQTKEFNNAPFSGLGGTYRAKVTQSGVSATSAQTFLIYAMRVTIPNLPVVSTANEPIRIYGVNYMDNVRQSIYKNNVEIASSVTTYPTYDFSGTTTSYSEHSLGTSIFASDGNYGLGSGNIYKIRIAHPTDPTIFCFSETFTVMS